MRNTLFYKIIHRINLLNNNNRKTPTTKIKEKKEQTKPATKPKRRTGTTSGPKTTATKAKAKPEPKPEPEPQEVTVPKPELEKEEIEKIWEHLKPRVLELIKEKETPDTKVNEPKTEPEPKPQEVATPKSETEKEEFDYEKVNTYINTQSKLNQWFMRSYEYTGERTKIEFEDIPIIREWESGKGAKAIAFTRMEDKLGLAQLQKDGVVGLHLSQPVDDNYLHLEDTALADKIKKALVKAKFLKKEVIKIFGGGTGFKGENIIKLLSDEYTVQFIDNKQMKRKWVVEITEDGEDDENNRKLKFTPMGQ